MRIPAHDARPDTLPEGDYRARLISAEATVAQSSGNPMVKCTYQVTAPAEHRGAELKDYVAFTERTWWKIDQTAKALRVALKAGDDVECDQFADLLFDASRKGVEVMVRVEHETSEEYGTQARIRKVLKLTDAQTKDVEPDIPVEEPVPEPEPAAASGVPVDDIPFRAEPVPAYGEVKGTRYDERDRPAA